MISQSVDSLGRKCCLTFKMDPSFQMTEELFRHLKRKYKIRKHKLNY